MEEGKLYTDWERDFRFEGVADRQYCNASNYNYNWRLKLDQIGNARSAENHYCAGSSRCTWNHDNVVAISLCIQYNNNSPGNFSKYNHCRYARYF